MSRPSLLSLLLELTQPDPVFTHFGWFCGLVPVYLTDPLHGREPEIAVRWWFPHIALHIAAFLYHLVAQVCMAFWPDFDPMFPILVTGKIRRRA